MTGLDGEDKKDTWKSYKRTGSVVRTGEVHDGPTLGVDNDIACAVLDVDHIFYAVGWVLVFG